MEFATPDVRTFWSKLRAAATAVSGEYWLLLAGALFQLTLRYRTYFAEYDHAWLLSSALSFLRRGSFSFLRVKPSDLSASFDWQVTHWPPGFSLCVAGLMKVLGSPLAAMVAYDLISMGLFFGACARMLVLMGSAFPRRARWLVAFTVSFVAPSYMDFYTNATSLAFLLWAIVLILPTREGRSPSMGACAFAGWLLGTTIGLRYAAAPASVMPIVILGVDAWRRRESRPLFYAAVAGWALGVLPLLVWKFFMAPGGSGLEPLRWGRPWYPENLLRFHSFPTDSFFGRHLTDIFPKSIYRFNSKVDVTQVQIRQLLSSLILLASVAGVRELLQKSSSAPEGAVVRRIFAAGISASAATIGFLMFLSVRNAGDPALSDWVYVEEPRYFNLCHPFILFGGAYLAVMRPTRWVTKMLKVVAIVVFVLAGASWIATLPHTMSKAWKGKWGGPIETRFANSATFAIDFKPHIVHGKRNVALEFGENGIGAWLRWAYANFYDIPSLTVWKGQPIHTTQDVVVIAFADKKQRPEHLKAFELFCREHDAEPLLMRDYQACRARLPAGT